MEFLQVSVLPKNKNDDLLDTSSDFPFEDVSLTGTDSLFEGNLKFVDESTNLNVEDSSSLSSSKPENSFQIFFKELDVQEEISSDAPEGSVEKLEKRAKLREKYKKVYVNKYKCGICKEFFSKFSQLLLHDKTDHKDLNFEAKCLKCGHVFVSNQRLELHDAMQHREKIHECEFCGLKCSTIKSLKVHKQKHSGKFKCNICVYSASSNSALKDHKLIHNSDKNFVCPHCCKRFKQRQALIAHVNSHQLLNDEIPSKTFRCDVCYKCFQTQEILQQHKQSHNGRSFVCETCGSFFKNNVLLNAHKSTHEPKENLPSYVCEICDKRFSSKTLQMRHAKAHILKRFDCKVCKASFTRKDSRELHMKKHYVTIPIQCHFCEQKFSLKRYLVRHLARKHSTKNA